MFAYNTQYLKVFDSEHSTDFSWLLTESLHLWIATYTEPKVVNNHHHFPPTKKKEKNKIPVINPFATYNL